jgi:hypothetical protein
MHFSGPRLHDTIIIFVILIKREFIEDPEADEHGDGHAQGEPADVDCGISFIAEQLSPPDFKMNVDHGVFDYIFWTFGRFYDAGAEEKDDVYDKLSISRSLVRRCQVMII